MDRPDYSDEKILSLKKALQAFQSQRLCSTYQDLIENREYNDIADFFFQKLYGPDDHEFRNTSMRTLHKAMDGRAPRQMFEAVSLVIELHDMSDGLDDRMVALMLENNIGEDIDLRQYQKIYRQMDNYDERVEQIELGIKATRIFFDLSRKWMVRLSLKTVRRVAHFLGIGQIMDFVYEGYSAFRTIRNIDYFAETIETREKAWNAKLFEENPQLPDSLE